MKEKILVYEKDPNGLRFLKSFFTHRDDLNAAFAKDVASLKKKALANRNDNILCIVAADEINQLNPQELSCPVIGVISGNPKTGIKTAVRYGIENYILSPFHKEDLESKIHMAFNRKKVLECLRREANDLKTITDLTYVVSSTLDPQEILYLIVKKISEAIDVTRCSIVRVDGHKRYVYVAATFEDPKLRNIKLDLAKYPEIRKAMTSKEHVIISDITTNPLMEKVRDIISPLGIRSILVIPIVFRNEIIGTLFLRTSRSGGSFKKSEIDFCKAIANASANALYHAFLFEKMEGVKSRLEKLAITDYLTGIFNARYFYHRLTEEFSRSERYKFNMHCLMFDIDHFKEVNDKFGHKTGDLVLREFAHLLKKYTRKSDVLTRYGGEEFIMLLLQTSKASAASKAEALRAKIEKYRFQGLKGVRKLTVSVGVSSYPNANIKRMEDLISLADNALYRAKITGRNRVVIYGP